MSFYLSPITICGKTVIHGGDSPPAEARDGEYFLQNPPALNSIWVKRQSRWISANSLSHCESILLYPDEPALAAQINLLPVQQSSSGYGTYIAESSFLGSALNSDDINYWSFQLQCGGTDIGAAFTSVESQGDANVEARQILLVGLKPNDGLLLQLAIAQVGNPGVLDGVFSLSYNLLYPNG